MKSKNDNSSWGTFLKILSFSGKSRSWIVLSVLGAIILSVCDAYSVNLLKLLVDKFTFENGNGFINIIIAMVGVIFVSIIFKYLIKYSSGKLGTNIIIDIRNEAINKIGNIKITEIDKNHSGDLVSKLSNNLTTIESFLSNELTNYIYIPLILLIAFIFLAFINWKLLLISFIPTPIALYLSRTLSKPIGKYSEKYYEQLGKVNCVASDAIKGIKILKAFNLRDVLYKKYKDILEQALKQGMKIETRNEALLPIIIITYELPLIFCAIFGGYMSVRGLIHPGGLIAFIQLLRLIIGPSTMLPNMISSYRNTMGAAKGLFSILEAPMELQNDNSSLPLQSKQDEVIEFENVSFSYNGTENVLHNISFKLSKGEKIAIVGPSGSGKSTIINLICGFYSPTSGSIKFYGNDIKDLSMKYIREHLSLVPQDNYLLPGTIEENIHYGKMTAEKDKVIKAAKIANIHDAIMEMPDEYNTKIVEGGSTLSGGQKQRISIARAVLKDAHIFLLDEPTSALDYQSEMIVKDALECVLKDKTTIMIAHRLSTIRDVDRIIVLSNGRIVESGNHNELIKNGNVYRELYLAQSSSNNEITPELI